MGGPDNTRWRNHLRLTPAQERQARRMLAEGDPHRGSQGARGVPFDVVPPAPAERFSVTRRSSAQHRGRETLELLGGYRAPDLPGGGIRGRSRAGRPRRAPFRVLGPVGRTRTPRHGCAGHRRFRRRAARCWLGRSGCHGCFGPSRDGQRVEHLHLYAVARSSLNRRSRRCTIRASCNPGRLCRLRSARCRAQAPLTAGKESGWAQSNDSRGRTCGGQFTSWWARW